MCALHSLLSILYFFQQMYAFYEWTNSFDNIFRIFARKWTKIFQYENRFQFLLLQKICYTNESDVCMGMWGNFSCWPFFAKEPTNIETFLFRRHSSRREDEKRIPCILGILFLLKKLQHTHTRQKKYLNILLLLLLLYW